MGRVVLQTGSHSVSGSITMPNGATDYGREPPYGGLVTGPGWSASCSIGVALDSCAVSFTSYGPESHTTYPGPFVFATVSVGSGRGGAQATAQIDTIVHSTWGPGRGVTGDTVDGSFSFDCISDLCLYTDGESDVDEPSDNYPRYGGPKVVGEHPSTYGRLVWEPHPGSTITGSVTIGGVSASCSAPSASANFSDSASFGIALTHSPVGGSAIADPPYGQSTRPFGILNASLQFDGADISTEGRTATYTQDGAFVCSGTIGAGYASASINTDDATGNVVGENTAGVSVGGNIAITRKASLALDAYAGESPHPHAVDWRAILKYKSSTDETDSEGYHTLIDPPEPIVTNLKGQSVGAQIEQVAEAVNVSALSKAYNAIARSGTWIKVRGYRRDGVYVTYQHYRNEQGAVLAWCIPPPGEDPNDWRVMFRGKAFTGLNVIHAGTSAVVLPSFSGNEGTDDKPEYTGTWGTPLVWEGYRYLKVDGSCISVRIGGKTFTVPDSRLIDLCFPDDSTVATDSTYTRWPLDRQGYSTVEGPLWGITKASSIAAIGGDITALTLATKEFAKAHFLEAFGDWQQYVPDDEYSTSDGDTYTVEYHVQRCGIGDVDGRQSFEAFDVLRITNNAPNRLYADDYYHQPISAVASQINTIPGYTATLGSKLDDYHDPATGSAFWLGQGYTQSGGSWTKGFNTLTGAVKAQPVFDSMSWSGDVKDVFNLGGGATLKLVGRKVFRSTAYGAGMNSGGGKAAEPYHDPAAIIHGKNTSVGGEITVGASTTQGYYWIGPTLSDPNAWGKLQLSWDAPNGSDDDVNSPEVGVGGVPRRIDRVAFATPAEILKGSVSYDVSGHGRHVVAWVDKGKAKLKLAANDNPTALGETIDPHIDADSLCVRWLRDRTEGIALMYSKDGQIYYRTSIDEGATFTMPIIIHSGSIPTFIVSRTSLRYVYWLEKNGSAYDIKGQIRSGQDDVVKDTFTVKTGVDGDGVACDESFGSEGEHRINVVYVEGGTIKSTMSKNGHSDWS